MEFDDEWITEREDPCLSEATHGWILVNVLKLMRGKLVEKED